MGDRDDPLGDDIAVPLLGQHFADAEERSRAGSRGSVDLHDSFLHSNARQHGNTVHWGGHAGSPPVQPEELRDVSVRHPGIKRISSKGHFMRDMGRPRRKLTWLAINHTGAKAYIQADKRTLIQKYDLGVPIRDMRLLDVSLVASETGKMLVRDNAIVFSMEHVRLLITAEQVFIPRDGFENNNLNVKFVERLEMEVAEAHKESLLERLNMEGTGDDEATHSSQLLPFELVVLEVALGEVCSSIIEAAKELEAKTLPALDALLKKVSKTGLEQVRKLKARQQRLTIRTQTMRDELERFLEDDNDLHKFCLTYKKQVEDMAKAERQRSLQAPDTGAAVGSQAPVGSMARYGALRGMMAGVQGTSPPHQWSGGDLAGMVSMRHSKSLGPGPFSGPGINPFGMDDSIVEATEDVENLLESYYMSIDNAYDKLISLDEYIKDTEEFIDIDLDWNRNRLIKLDIVLTTATFAVAPFNVFAGMLGENVIIPWFMARDDMGAVPFYVINASVFMCCLAVFFSIVGYIRYRNLL